MLSLLLAWHSLADEVSFKPVHLPAAALLRQFSHKIKNFTNPDLLLKGVTLHLSEDGASLILKGSTVAIAGARQALALFDEPLRRVDFSVKLDVPAKAYHINHWANVENYARASLSDEIAGVDLTFSALVNEDDTMTVSGVVKVDGQATPYLIRMRPSESCWLRPPYMAYESRVDSAPTQWYEIASQPGMGRRTYPYTYKPDDVRICIRAKLGH